VIETDVELADGRTVHVYDGATADDSATVDDGATADADLAVFWHHGTPQTGQPPVPMLARPGVRWVGHDRPGYGGSTPQPGRDVASVAADVAAIADALGIGRFAVMGASGGGPHALACAALLPDRVLAVVSLAGLAPFGADGLDWYAGMYDTGVAELTAAVRGRAALAAFLAGSDFDPSMFTSADHAELADGDYGPWLAACAGQGMAKGPDPFVDDDLAFVGPWGFDPTAITVPIRLLHGGQDRAVPATHGEWLAKHCRTADLVRYPDDGHISVFHGAPDAMDWLIATARR
jgi:pimeloyl-ACP methyl ester carboxylesterase